MGFELRCPNSGPGRVCRKTEPEFPIPVLSRNDELDDEENSGKDHLEGCRSSLTSNFLQRMESRFVLGIGIGALGVWYF